MPVCTNGIYGVRTISAYLKSWDMTRVLFWLLALVCAMPQNLQGQDSVRNVKIKLVDTKGKLVRSGGLSYGLTRKPDTRHINQRGWSVIRSVRDSDTLLVMLNGYIGALPLRGLDSVEICDRRRNLDPNPFKKVNLGYQTVLYKDNTHTVNTLNVKKDHSVVAYRDLGTYLEGRIAGLKVVYTEEGKEIQLRGGTGSLMGSNAALIVVDGVECLNFDQANSLVDVNDIERIDVIKDGEGYGIKGSNGVVVITTKRGGNSDR